METINMHYKNISQIQYIASRLKVISPVEHTEEKCNEYKQVYAQTEALKIIFQGSRKPTTKMCDENENKKK